jgi:hypothetical protein
LVLGDIAVAIGLKNNESRFVSLCINVPYDFLFTAKGFMVRTLRLWKRQFLAPGEDLIEIVLMVQKSHVLRRDAMVA